MYIGNVVIPIDEPIFFGGAQPDITRSSRWTGPWSVSTLGSRGRSSRGCGGTMRLEPDRCWMLEKHGKSYGANIQWVDLRENLQENIDFPMKYRIFPYFFSLNQSIETWDGD